MKIKRKIKSTQMSEEPLQLISSFNQINFCKSIGSKK